MVKTSQKVYLAQDEEGVRHLFSSWSECEKFVKGTSRRFVSGPTATDAEQRLNQLIHPGNARIQSPKKSKPARPASYPTLGICSDAGTHGNPGPCSFRVTRLDGHILLEKELGVHSNNYAALAGIGAMIQSAIVSGEKLLWTDSQIALGWIANGRIGMQVHERETIIRMVQKIQALLQRHPEIELRKWKTREWGQIPADYGRK
ncbi:MAG: hypothetical protein KDC71_07580 [Acidobacteria bacterium]|nr:hypothetical protein [Acidobacteriota bacterium]